MESKKGYNEILSRTDTQVGVEWWGRDGLGVWDRNAVKLGCDDHCTTINAIKFIGLKINCERTYLMNSLMRENNHSGSLIQHCFCLFPSNLKKIYYGKTLMTNFTILVTFRVQFSDIRYIHGVVQPSSPSISKILFIL